MGGCCSVVAIEHGKYSLCLYAETVSSTGSVWYVRIFKLCCEILLLLNMIWQIWIVFYVESCGVRSAECHVHSVGVVG